MSEAHQLLFGYDNGHRLLSGSCELESDTLVRLLGATDAAMSADSAPLVTGLALRPSDEYAFCVIWSAPEAPRAGAVWGHALIIDDAELRDSDSCRALLRLPRRPSAEAPDLSRYAIPLTLDGSGEGGSPLAPQAQDRALLEYLVIAAYGAGGDGILVHRDLGAAARALLALWRAQWPELREVFSFRTREVVRREPSEFDLTVTAKVRGPDESPAERSATASPRWVAALAGDLLAEGSTPLREFLWAFGPQEPPARDSVRHLTKLWLAVSGGNVVKARNLLERHWPEPTDGGALKQALFGSAQNRWWEIDERTRVRALLEGEPEHWDAVDLEVIHRARALALA